MEGRELRGEQANLRVGGLDRSLVHEILRLELLYLLQHRGVRRGHRFDALRHRRTARNLPHAHRVEVAENVLERNAELKLASELAELRLDRSLHREILVDDRGCESSKM